VTVVCYSVPHELTSPRWARAFARGCGGTVSVGSTLASGDVALFGSPHRWQLLQQAQAEGRQWYYGDHAYFGRRRFFRATRGAYQLCDLSGYHDPRGFEQFAIAVKKWRSGSDILLCPNSPPYFERFGTTAEAWIEKTTSELRNYTGRTIRVRWKNGGGGEFEYDLKNVHAVVVFTSVCGVHAALAGAASFATAPCASRAFGTDDLSRIENPVRPDNRFEMACALAANQWTFGEMASGKAWKELNK